MSIISCRSRPAKPIGESPTESLWPQRGTAYIHTCGVKRKDNGSVQPQQVSVYGREEIGPWPIPEYELKAIPRFIRVFPRASSASEAGVVL